MSNNKYEVLGTQILELVGGKDNVSSLTNCVTRLRFNLKDQSLVDQNKIKALSGVMGCQFSSGQFQIIIGPDVKKVLNVIAPQIDGKAKNVVKESEKEKLTIKNVFSKILTNFTACITPALPVIICAGMLKLIAVIVGPIMLGLIEADTGIYTILSFAGDAGFYFLPVYLGYTSAKHFNTSVFIGMLLGAILIHPTLMSIILEGGSLDLLGLPVTLVNYSSSVLPIVLIVWVMSYVRRFIDQIMPKMLKMILVDVLTVIIMLPIALCVLGPLGSILSIYITNAFLAIHNVLGPLGIGLIAALYLPLILTGMHHAVNLAAIVTMTSIGYDNVIFVAAAAAILSVLGANLAFIIKTKKVENRSLGVTATIMQAVGGIVEPTLFGIYLPYKKIFVAQSIGAFTGATVMGFLRCKIYALMGSNVFILAGFLGEDSNNFIYACIGCAVAIVVAFILTFILGFDENQEVIEE